MPCRRPLREARARGALLAAAVVALALVAPLPAAAHHDAEPRDGDYQQVLSITLPADPRVSFGDTYDACRDGCARIHKAADLMGAKLWGLYAAVDGGVCRMTGVDEPMPTSGYSLTVCGDDGRRYRYIHLNNDNPGTDDGLGGPEWAFAPGMAEGRRVVAGEWVGYMGDSGNAEGTQAHLHFDIFDDAVTDPYGDHRINPYPSLASARRRGALPTRPAPVQGTGVDRVAGATRVETAVAISASVHQAATTVVLARADSFAEAVVAGPLAAVLGGPVLLTGPERLDPSVAGELRRLGVGAVVFVGGLTPQVDEDLRALGVTVELIAGADVAATAALVAERVWAAGQTIPVDVPDDAAQRDAAAARAAVKTRQQEAPVGLVVSDEPDRSDPRGLTGEVLSGDTYVFARGLDPDDTLEVRFYLDDPAMLGDPVHVERREPYDLAGTAGDGPDAPARPFDTTELNDGPHTLSVSAPQEYGLPRTGVAVFQVHNGAVAEPEPEEDPDRAPRRALVALGSHPDPSRAWPDALVASYYGARTATPVLLVEPDVLPPATAAALDGVDHALLVGGEAAVSAAVADQIRDRGVEVGRVAGPNRFATAAAVTDVLIRADLVTRSWVWGASGGSWADAVTAGPAVARAGAALVLLDGAGRGGDPDVGRWLFAHATEIASARIIGGESAVSATAASRLSLRTAG